MGPVQSGSLHDLVQLVVCGDGGVAPWRPGMYSSLGRWHCLQVFGEVQSVGGRHLHFGWEADNTG